MRTIEWTGQFTRDYKREARGRYRSSLDSLLAPVVDALVNDRALEPRHRDHTLSGEWAGFRECHIKPDLLLIYRKPDPITLHLVRLGSHAEFGF